MNHTHYRQLTPNPGAARALLRNRKKARINMRTPAPLTQARTFVDSLSAEEVRVYARIAPTLASVKNYKQRTNLESLVQAVCQDRVGRSVTP